MIDGGAIAKNRFRYQDMCAMYFSLQNYLQNMPSFEHIHCEQDKLDFEVWCKECFDGYQVKDKKQNITAKEANLILKDYIQKAKVSDKNIKNFWFIFTQKPNKSLGHLFLKLNGDAGVQKYKKPTEKYIKTALGDLDNIDLNVDYHCYKQKEIEYLVYAASSTVLKNGLKSSEDIPSEAIRDFLSRLRDEIDVASTQDDSSKRIYSAENMTNLVKSYLGRIIKTSYNNEGREKVAVDISTYSLNNKSKNEVSPPVQTIPTDRGII